MPDGGTSKPVYYADSEPLSSLSRADDFGGGPLADALGVAIAPDMRRKNLLMAGVNVVAYRLADEMGGDGVALQSFAFQQAPLGVAIRLIGLCDIEMIAPAGEFYAIVTKALDLREQCF
jgi:hypothetical protein